MYEMTSMANIVMMMVNDDEFHNQDKLFLNVSMLLEVP